MRIASSLIVIAWLSLCTPVFAQADDEAATTRRQTLVRDYFEAIAFDKLMEASTSAMVGAQTDALPASPDLPADTREILADVALDVMRDVRGQMTERFVVLYAEVFTETELHALVDFYESDVGRAITAGAATVALQSGSIMADMMPEVTEMMRTRLCARIKCPATLDPGKFD